jgi:endonuclease YncB( thermonuclease family)
MHLKTFSTKSFFIVGLLIGITIHFFTFLSFARETIRTVTGTVTKVSDGDTIHVTTPEQTKLRVRLYGIDAPETPKTDQHTGRVNIPGQPNGEESKKALEAKIMGQQIRLDIIDIDQYKRMIGMVWIGNRNVNLEMLQEGYAEVYYIYLKEPYKRQFLQAQRDAKSAKIGIWSLRNYESPRDFRKRFKMRDDND